MILKTLKKGIRNAKSATIIAPLFVSFEALFEIFIPRIMALIVDSGIEVNNLANVYKYGAIMIATVILSLTCGIIASRNAAKASTTFAKTIREDMYHNIQSYSFENIDKFSSASLVTRLTTDVTNVQNAFHMIMIMLFRAPFMLIFGIIMSFTISSKLAIVFICAVPFMLGFFFFFLYKAQPNFVKMFKKYDELNSVVQENVGGIRTVKSYVREEQQNKKFQKTAKELYQYSIGAEKYLALANPVVQFTMYACIVLISWLGAKMIITGEGGMTTGTLMSLIAYVTQILMSLMMVSMVTIMITMSKASANRIVEVINEKSSIVNKQNPITKIKDGSIDFKNVSFCYLSNKKVLEDVSLHINSGETIGIIGGTGSSKTTLVQLISRLYDVSDGAVSVGNVDVRDYDLDTLRNNVSVVLQKNILFSGTIKDNLRWGNETATDEELIEAAKKAQAHDFIMSFPLGYDTKIEQGGVNVSGGQKQRLCIARALLKKPKILILDDSTSAIDVHTDAKIRESFKRDLPEVTKIIIAQKILSIKDSDRILVLDNGKINGFDTHENLLQSNEIYQDVYYTQMKGEE